MKIFASQPSRALGDRQGWRVRLPILPWWRTDYDFERDMEAVGWWCLRIAFGFNTIGTKGLGTFGFALRFTWGWRPLKVRHIDRFAPSRRA